MSRLVRARLGYAAGLASLAGGIFVEFGTGWALITGGVACAASFLLLADTDEGAARDKPVPPRPPR